MNSGIRLDRDVRKYKAWGYSTFAFGIAVLVLVYWIRSGLYHHPEEELRLVRIAILCTLCGVLIVWGSLALFYSRLLRRLREILEENRNIS